MFFSIFFQWILMGYLFFYMNTYYWETIFACLIFLKNFNVSSPILSCLPLANLFLSPFLGLFVRCSMTNSEHSQNGFSVAICLNCWSGRRENFSGPRKATWKLFFQNVVCFFFSVSLFPGFIDSPSITQILSQQLYFSIAKN